jgi:hypothetical protein
MIQQWVKKTFLYRRFFKTPAGQFFRQNRRLLLQYPAFQSWFFVQRPFAILQANILLRGIIQKQRIDLFLKQEGFSSIQTHGRIKHHLIRDRFKEHMTFKYQFDDDHAQPIILPFFNRALNFIYRQEPDKLYDYPYNRLDQDFAAVALDAFEHYGWRLFASNFATLIPLHLGDRSSQAFYDQDAKLIFIINQQGREDAMIALDPKMKKKDPTIDDISGLKAALTFYFSHDRIRFIQALATAKLITPRHAQRLLANHPQPLILR